MRAVVADANVLHALGPSEVSAYLRHHHWKFVEQIDNKGAVWTTRLSEDMGGEEAELLLPLDRRLNDYVRRMSEVLHTLEVAEKRSQLDILSDISDAGADVIRIRLQGTPFEDGSLPIDHAVHVVSYAREMMLAAACSVVQPRIIYRSRKPTPASEYMSKVRLGQTERGSYVLSIRSLVPPQLTGSQLSLPNIETEDGEYRVIAEEPFERRVTRQLAEALTAVTNALSQVRATGDVTPFQDAVAKGVSANLCHALAGMGLSDTPLDMDIGMSWASTRGLPKGVTSTFRLSSDAFPVLYEVARLLREQAPFGTVELSGPVVELRRDEGAFNGQSTACTR
jgi:hypothetical protein